MIKSVFDRELIQVLHSLLAKERREPIHIRLVSPHIGDFQVLGENLMKKLVILRTRKSAAILLLLDKRSHNNYIKLHGDIPEEVKRLQDAGVRVQTIRNLHAKIVMVENRQEKCLLVSSANLTDTAYRKNHEVGIYIQSEREDIYVSFGKYITNLLKSINA